MLIGWTWPTLIAFIVVMTVAAFVVTWWRNR